MQVDLETYYRVLRALDWDYEYSEDRRAWQRGYEAMNSAIHRTSESKAHADMFAVMRTHGNSGRGFPTFEQVMSTIAPTDTVAAE